MLTSFENDCASLVRGSLESTCPPDFGRFGGDGEERMEDILAVGG